MRPILFYFCSGNKSVYNRFCLRVCSRLFCQATLMKPIHWKNLTYLNLLTFLKQTTYNNVQVSIKFHPTWGTLYDTKTISKKKKLRMDKRFSKLRHFSFYPTIIFRIFPFRFPFFFSILPFYVDTLLQSKYMMKQDMPKPFPFHSFHFLFSISFFFF